MGLDASVRCRCFEEGKLKPGPVPTDDLYIDEDGYLASRTLDEAHKQFDYRRFDARYGALDDAFCEWANHCCEHEFGEYRSEWVSNWEGCAEFEDLVEEVGGEEEFPLLSKLLSRGNGGLYPTEKAEATLEELDRFIKVVSDVDEWALCEAKTGKEIWTSTGHGSFTWMSGPHGKVGMRGGKVYFYHAGLKLVETTHFKQFPIAKRSADGDGSVRIVCIDTGEVTETFASIGSEGAPCEEREFYVVSKKAPFLFEGKYGTAERIHRLLLASIETGNPIRWC